MTWEANRGRAGKRAVPAAVLRAVRVRDNGECQLRYPCCTGQFDHLDHKRNLASQHRSRRDPVTADELQCVCVPCHKLKTQREAAAGRTSWRRPAERHPGLLR